MRNRSEVWCEADDANVNEIENRALLAMQNGEFPTLVFISSDIYAELQKSLGTQMRFMAGHQPPGQSIMSINTSAGSLNIQHVKRLRNFLLVGRKEDFDEFTQNGVDPVFWNDQERVRIDKAFEDMVILTGEDDEKK